MKSMAHRYLEIFSSAGWRRRALRPFMFCRCRRGAIAVEMALVTPVMLALTLGIIQFGMLFYLQNSMVNAARETSRALAIGSITSSQAQTYAEGLLVDWNVTFTVNPQMPNAADPTDTAVVVSISAPMSQAVVVDPFGVFGSNTISANAVMRKQF